MKGLEQKRNSLKIRTTEIYSFLMVFLTVSYDYLRMYGMNNKIYLTVCLAAFIILCFMKLMKNKFQKNEFFKFLLLVIFSVVTVFGVGEVNFIYSIFLAVMFYKEDLKSFFKHFLNSSVVCYLMTFILYFFNVLSNNVTIRTVGESIQYRNSFGFDHPNSVFLYFLPIVICSYVLLKKNTKFYTFIIFIISTILYHYTDCRTGYFCILIFLFLINIKSNFNGKLFRTLLKYSFIILTLSSVFICKKYGSNGSNLINNLLSLRPFYLNRYMNLYPIINLFGGYFNSKMPLDNFYIYLLLEKGIIIYLIYAYLSVKYLSNKMLSKKMVIINLIFMIYCIFESYTVLPAINLFLVLELIYFISNKEKGWELD